MRPVLRYLLHRQHNTQQTKENVIILVYFTSSFKIFWTKMTNFEEEFLGPFFYNSTIVCLSLNASRLLSFNDANLSLSSSPPGERIAPNLMISVTKTNTSFYSSESWWLHPVSSRHRGWHGTTYWVFLEHIIRCHDHHCDPREYRCPLHCHKYALDLKTGNKYCVVCVWKLPFIMSIT